MVEGQHAVRNLPEPQGRLGHVSRGWNRFSRRVSKDYFGLDHSEVRRYTALLRHTVLTMAALAICPWQMPRRGE